MNLSKSIYSIIDDAFASDEQLLAVYEAYVEESEPILEREFFIKTPKEADIKKAIQGRKYVGIYYEDEDDSDVLAGFRLIEPYAYGRGYKHSDGDVVHQDREYLRAFVVRDTKRDPEVNKKFATPRKSASKSKSIPYYRLFRVDRIRDWKPFDKTFSGYRELYNPDDKTLGEIIASLDYSEFPRGEVPLR